MLIESAAIRVATFASAPWANNFASQFGSAPWANTFKIFSNESRLKLLCFDHFQSGSQWNFNDLKILTLVKESYGYFLGLPQTKIHKFKTVNQSTNQSYISFSSHHYDFIRMKVLGNQPLKYRHTILSAGEASYPRVGNLPGWVCVQGDLSSKDHSMCISKGLSSQHVLVEVFP